MYNKLFLMYLCSIVGSYDVPSSFSDVLCVFVITMYNYYYMTVSCYFLISLHIQINGLGILVNHILLSTV